MTTVPPLCLVDVNVGIAANGEPGVCTVCKACQLECIETLEALMANGRAALDDQDLIWAEYMNHLRIAGEPGMGDQFLRWVHDNQWQGGRCERVPITPVAGPPPSFAEFPNDPALANFDLSDRKYVAVAAACANLLGPATILNAADSDWKHHEAALAANGVSVAHLCPDELKD